MELEAEEAAAELPPPPPVPAPPPVRSSGGSFKPPEPLAPPPAASTRFASTALYLQSDMVFLDMAGYCQLDSPHPLCLVSRRTCLSVILEIGVLMASSQRFIPLF